MSGMDLEIVALIFHTYSRADVIYCAGLNHSIIKYARLSGIM
jgi:hypothetical protein